MLLNECFLRVNLNFQSFIQVKEIHHTANLYINKISLLGDTFMDIMNLIIYHIMDLSSILKKKSLYHQSILVLNDTNF
jgi:hypothetical protein